MSRISLEEYQEFCNHRNVNNPCEACGGTTWGFFDDPNGELGIPIEDKPGTWDASTNRMPLICVACENCGNLRFHAKKIIEKFVMEWRRRGGQNGQ